MNCLQVEANLSHISLIEKFIASSREIPQDKRTAALIIATEVFDNLAEHAVFEEKKEVHVSASALFFPRLCFSYKSSNFDNLLTALKRTKPHFDAGAQRYRGFGLRMTKNLARRVSYLRYLSHCYIIVYL